LRICSAFFLLGQTQQIFFTQRMLASWFFAARREPAINQFVTACEALRFQIFPELVSVAASLRQTFFQVGDIRIKQTLCPQNIGSLRKSSCVDKVAHGTPAHAKLLGDAQDTHSLLVEGHGFFVACLASETSDLRGCHFRLTSSAFVSAGLWLPRSLVL